MGAGIELQKAERGDAKRIFESWGYHEPNFRYLSAPPQRSIQDAQGYLDKIMENPKNPIFHIVEKAENITVGLIKAKLEGHRALVGYVINEPYWGRGIAATALEAMIGELRKNSMVRRIWATCATNNPASIAVLEKCEFVREGILRNWIVYPAQGDNPHDNYSYSLPT